MAPNIVSGALKAIELAENASELRQSLTTNTLFFREQLQLAGFDILAGEHPIVPVMFYDAKLANEFAKQLNSRGLYLTAFTFPVVPENKARIRIQISAAHTTQQLDYAIEQFKIVKKNPYLKTSSNKKNFTATSPRESTNHKC